MLRMQMTSETPKGWRDGAVRLIEELFPVTSECYWDQLLDLRSSFLADTDGNELIREFLRCKGKLELDHFLPFYRLRRILAAHLSLEGMQRNELRCLLREGKVFQPNEEVHLSDRVCS